MIVTILRPLLVVGYGSNCAALFAALMLLAQGRKQVLFEAALVGTMAGIMLSVLALWGIRYPSPVVHLHKHLIESRVIAKPPLSWKVQETPDTPAGHYGLTVRIDDPFQDWPYTRQLLRMMTHDLLNNRNGHASNNFLPGYKEPEIKAYSTWLIHRKLAKEVRNSAVLHEQGRLDLQDLYPTMQT